MKKIPGKILKHVVNLDGWKNILTGIGVKGKDRRLMNKIEWDQFTEADAEELYAASDVAGKIVDEVVHEAFREGYELKFKGSTPATLKLITAEGARLKVDERIQQAWKYARMYGGGAIIAIPTDLTKLNSPLIPEQVQQIKSLLVLTRWELPRGEIEYDIRDPNFGHPKYYRICPRSGAEVMNERVHYTRVLRFDGVFLPRIKFIANNHWHDSVLNKCKTAIRDYDAGLAAISATLDDFSVGVLKLKDLTQSIAEDRDDLITKRLEIANLSRSIAKMVVLDADKEEFDYQDRSLTGVADCFKLIAGRLVVASNMPHTKILGESPEGSNATGNSTTKDWYDYVRAQQENYLDERLITLWKWILAAKTSPTKGKVPDDLEASYAALWQEPESVQATMRYTQAQCDDLNMRNGVLEPQEVRASRFGSGEYSTQTKLLNPDADAVLEDARAAANPPDPNADPNEPDAKTGKKPDPKKPDPKKDKKK